MDTNTTKMKTAYQITERNGKAYWTRIGVAFTNRDGSLNVKLDSIPHNFQFQLRDYDPAETRDGRRGAEAGGALPAATAATPSSALS